jgi:hypothetical protein
MEEGIYGGGKERWRKERKMEEGIYEGREYMQKGRKGGRKESRRKVDRDEVRKMEEGIYGGRKERCRKEQRRRKGYMKEGRKERIYEGRGEGRHI